MIRLDGDSQQYYSEVFRQAADVLIAYADGMTAGRALPPGGDSGGSPSTGDSGTSIAPKDDGLDFAADSGPAADASPTPAPASERQKLELKTEGNQAREEAASFAVPEGIMTFCGPIYQAGPAHRPVAGEKPTPREIVLVWGPDAYAAVERWLR